jgi:hypothetical protein
MKTRHLIKLCLVIGLLGACGRPAAPPAISTVAIAPTATALAPTPTTRPGESPAWFREAIVYEVVPRSFYDSNGDGMGDLRGITARLDYIQLLGANTLWLTPIFSSTSTAGFDVMDFYSLAPGLGTKDDFVELVNQAHSRKLRVVMDLVTAYTSNGFPQFKQSLGKLDSDYSDWYQWTTLHTTCLCQPAHLPLLNHKNAAAEIPCRSQARTGVTAFDWAMRPVCRTNLSRSAGCHRSIERLAPKCGPRPAKLAPYFQDESTCCSMCRSTRARGRPDRNGEAARWGQLTHPFGYSDGRNQALQPDSTTDALCRRA